MLCPSADVANSSGKEGAVGDSSPKSLWRSVSLASKPRFFISSRKTAPTTGAAAQSGPSGISEEKPSFVMSPLTQFLATRTSDAASSVASGSQHTRASLLLSNKNRLGKSHSEPDLRDAGQERLSVRAHSQLDLSAEHAIKMMYDKVISYCLGLSDRSAGTSWDQLNPYDKSAGESSGTLKGKYLNKMLGDTAFGVGAEFQNLVNQINTNVLNIGDQEMIANLLIKSGARSEEILNNPNVSLKGQENKDRMWEITARHCIDFFDTAAAQHSALPSRTSSTPNYDFDLLIKLQSFNVRFSLLERDVDVVNYNLSLTSPERMARLTNLQQRAADLQNEVGPLYRFCEDHRLDSGKTAFILGERITDEQSGAQVSKKVADFKKKVDQAIQQLHERSF